MKNSKIPPKKLVSIIFIIICQFLFKNSPIIITIITSITIIITRPWTAFGRQGLVGLSFEYSYTRLALRLRRLARSGIMTLGKDKTPSLLEPFNLPIFQHSNIPTFRPSNLPAFPKRQCLETGKLTKFFEYFKGFCRFLFQDTFCFQ